MEVPVSEKQCCSAAEQWFEPPSPGLCFRLTAVCRSSSPAQLCASQPPGCGAGGSVSWNNCTTCAGVAALLPYLRGVKIPNPEDFISLSVGQWRVITSL